MKIKRIIRCLAFISLMCFQSAMSAQPPGDQQDQLAQENDPCKDASFTVTYNNQSNNVINLDCPKNTTIILNIVDNNEWRCYFDNGCRYEYKVYVKNKLIYHGPVSNSGNSKYSIDPQIVAVNATERETIMRVEIVQVCVISAMVGTTVSTVIENETFTIQTISTGQHYKKVINTGQLAVERICAESPGPGEVICCNPNETWSLKVKNVTAVETSIEGQFKVNASVSWSGIKSSNGIFQFSGTLGSLEGTIKKSIKWTNSTELEASFSMQGEKGYCVGPGIQVTYAVYLEEYYTADCDNDPSNDIKQDYTAIVYADGHPSLIKCYYTPFNSCPEPLPEFEHKGGNRLFASSDCNGTILVTSLGEEISESSLDIVWTNDITSQSYNTRNLVNVPFGNYTLTITNECCETFTYHRFLCENEQIAGNWLYNPNTGEWCAEFNCSNPGLRNSCNTTRCVQPDRIDIFYQDGKCREMHYFMNEELGVAEINDKDPLKETEYDDFYDECVYKFYCDGSSTPSAITTDEPDSEEWVFDDFDEKCHLNVICDGQLFEDVDAIEPEVVWDWDDFFDECYSTFILCDGDEVEGELTTTPYNIGDWDEIFIPNDCKREIECVDGGEVFEDTGFLEAEEDGQDQDCNEDFFYYKIYCNGEFVKRICSGYHPMTQDQPLENRSTSGATILQFNRAIYIKIDKNMINLNIEIYDLLSKMVVKKPCDNLQEVKIDMNSFADGFYYVRLTKDNKPVAGKKIIIY